MASRFWVGGTGTWDATTTHWSATSGGSSGASAPGSSDSVFFDALSSAAHAAYTVTMSATPTIVGLSIDGPGSGNKVSMAMPGFPGISLAGDLNVVGGTTGVNFTSFGGIINFVGVAGVTQKITCNGTTLPELIFNGGASSTIFQLQDDCTTQNATTAFDVGTFDGNGHKFKIIAPSNGASIGGGNNTFAPTFYDLEIDASVAATFTTAAGFTVTHNLTIVGGDSTLNRILISGATHTITCNGIVTASNSDWLNVVAAGSATWDLSASTGGSGDALGNTGITFTVAANQHWINASSGTWSTAANWTSRVPLPQDNVFFDNAFGTAQTVTVNMPRSGKNIDWTGATWTTSLTFTSSATHAFYGNVKLISGLTHTAAETWSGRSSNTYDAQGVSINAATNVACVAGNTYILAGNFTLDPSKTFTMTSGALDTGGYQFSVGKVASALGATATITLNSSLVLLTGTGTVWTQGAASTFTVVPGTSIIKVTDTSNTAITFGGFNATYATLWWARGGSTATNTITGNNTFLTFQDTGTAAHSIVFPNATTVVTNFVVNGSSGALITLSRTGASGTFTLSSPSRIVYCNWLSISNSVATGNASWYAGANSTNGGTNTGWVFETATPQQIRRIIQHRRN